MANNKSVLRLVTAIIIVGVAAATYLLRPASENEKAHNDVTVGEESIQIPRLLDLGADKCVPCKMMAPILEELKTDYAGVMAVEFVDVWKNPDAAKPYGISIIPTQIFFAPDGTELFRHEGFISREDILSKWLELGIELEDKGA